MTEEKCFSFGGHHFLPVGKLKRDDDSFSRISRHCRSDFSLGLSTYEWKKNEYSYDGFYGASLDKECDLFLCLETGQVYIPAANELFMYTERKRVLSIQAKYRGVRERFRIGLLGG